MPVPIVPPPMTATARDTARRRIAGNAGNLRRCALGEERVPQRARLRRRQQLAKQVALEAQAFLEGHGDRGCDRVDAFLRRRKVLRNGGDRVACELEESRRRSDSRSGCRGCASAADVHRRRVWPTQARLRRRRLRRWRRTARYSAIARPARRHPRRSCSTPPRRRSPRGSRWVPPAPGSSPSRTSGNAIDAPADATRKWQPSASSRPPPTHVPPMAAMTGFPEPSSARISVCSVGSASAFGVLNSRMSAPPENSAPAPVSTIAVTEESASARSTPATIALRVSNPRPLTGGLSIVMTQTPPCNW